MEPLFHGDGAIIDAGIGADGCTVQHFGDSRSAQDRLFRQFVRLHDRTCISKGDESEFEILFQRPEASGAEAQVGAGPGYAITHDPVPEGTPHRKSRKGVERKGTCSQPLIGELVS